MKKKNLFLMSLLFSALTLFTACDDKGEDNNGNDGVDTELQGEYAEDLILDASKAYTLNGACIMLDGATLTIPAGTKITAEGNTTSYIAISQGAKIEVQGTTDSPVVMTSTVKSAGSWGGLIVCGKAPINTGDGSMSEVGNLPYGGSDANDNSGSIEHLRVEYTGYVFTDEKQFNGITFFGVGAGTVVDYIVSYKGNDDGVEFFGGTVNASHVVSIESGDDGIDFADGWSGTGEYWYAYNSAKSGIEGSNNGDNGAATPMTTATLKHVTAYIMSEHPWYLKEGAGKQTIDDVVIGGLSKTEGDAYFYKKSSDADVLAENITISNVMILDLQDNAKASTGITIGESVSATGAGNGVKKPEWISDAMNTIEEGVTLFPADLTDPVVDLAGEYSADLTLSASTTYILTGACVMKEGTKLTIPAGTVITSKNSTTTYIAISQGAQIDVQGTQEKPVVMTSDVKTAGSWGGLIICGKAPINTGDGSMSEVGNLPYGGDDAADNSGSIQYLRVEYTGYVFTDEKQFNGVTFFGVGSGTRVDYVSSYKGNDDGLEFFGGAVNASHIVSIESGDDGIDFADGWAGTGEYWYSLNSAKSGIEGSNNGDNGAATPMTTATIKHVTVMGMNEHPWYLKEGAGKQTISNVVIGGLTKADGDAYFYKKSSDSDVLPDNISITDVLILDLGGNDKASAGITVGENADATGAGAGKEQPEWAKGWSTPED